VEWNGKERRRAGYWGRDSGLGSGKGNEEKVGEEERGRESPARPLFLAFRRLCIHLRFLTVFFQAIAWNFKLKFYRYIYSSYVHIKVLSAYTG